MNHALNKATRNKMRALTEADVIDALENVCKKDFLEYVSVPTTSCLFSMRLLRKGNHLEFSFVVGTE